VGLYNQFMVACSTYAKAIKEVLSKSAHLHQHYWGPGADSQANSFFSASHTTKLHGLRSFADGHQGEL